MNGRDHGVRIGGQEPEQLMDALDRRALWAAHAFPLRPYPREGKQRPVLIQRKPGRSLARLRVGVLAEKSWPGPRIVRPPVRAPDALTRRGASIPRRPRSSCCKEAGRQDCPPRPLGSFQNGRGGGAARSVPGNSECKSPRSVHRHWPDIEDHRLGWPARPLVGDTRPNPGLWIGRPGIWAIAAPQQRGRRAVTDEILVERLERGLRSVTKVRNRRAPIRGNPCLKPSLSAKRTVGRFVWTASASAILAKMVGGRQALSRY